MWNCEVFNNHISNKKIGGNFLSIMSTLWFYNIIRLLLFVRHFYNERFAQCTAQIFSCDDAPTMVCGFLVK